MAIPVLDLADPNQGRLVDELHAALQTWGFVGLVGHGLPEALVSRCYQLTEALFALPDAAKRAYETPEDGVRST